MITTIIIKPTTPATIPIINPILVASSSGASSMIWQYRRHDSTLYSRWTDLPVSKGADRGDIAHPPVVQALYATLINSNIYFKTKWYSHNTYE